MGEELFSGDLNIPSEQVIYSWPTSPGVTDPYWGATVPQANTSGELWSFLNTGLPRLMDSYFHRPISPENSTPVVYTSRPLGVSASGAEVAIPSWVWIGGVIGAVFLLAKD